MRIELTRLELANAYKVAKLKTEDCIKNKQRNRDYGVKVTDNYAINLQGCLGEQAVAKYLGVPYEYTEYDKEAYDVMGYEVRATFHENGQLLNHPDDKTGIYILAIINPESYAVTLFGFI